jgi:serine/threonine protein phosphatase PrpC
VLRRFDGHGGKEAAAFAAGHLARSIAGKLSSNAAETVLKDSFLKGDAALGREECKLNGE